MNRALAYRSAYALHIFLFCGNLTLAYLLFGEHYFTGMYASSLHRIGRLHALLTHVTIALTFFYAFLLAVKSRLAVEDLLPRAELAALLSAGFTFLTGALMELCERYPNSAIRTHFLLALVFYAFLTLVPLLGGLKIAKRSMVATAFLALLLLASLFLSASFGGTVHKGQGFLF